MSFVSNFSYFLGHLFCYNQSRSKRKNNFVHSIEYFLGVLLIVLITKTMPGYCFKAIYTGWIDGWIDR